MHLLLDQKLAFYLYFSDFNYNTDSNCCVVSAECNMGFCRIAQYKCCYLVIGLDIDRMLSCLKDLVITSWPCVVFLDVTEKETFFNRVNRVVFLLFLLLLVSCKDIKAHHVCSCEPCETVITHPLEERANCWCYRSVIKQRWFGSLGMLRGTPCARCAAPLVQLWDRHIRTLTHALTAPLYCSSLRVISSAVLGNPLGTYLGKKGESLLMFR